MESKLLLIYLKYFAGKPNNTYILLTASSEGNMAINDNVLCFRFTQPYYVLKCLDYLKNYPLCCSHHHYRYC